MVPHLQRVREGLIDLLRRGEPTAGVGDILGELTTRTRSALESLRGLTRGVFPTQLERRGLVAALDAHLAQNGTGRVSATPDAHRRAGPADRARSGPGSLSAVGAMLVTSA